MQKKSEAKPIICKIITKFAQNLIQITMDIKQQVLEVFQQSAEALNAGKVAEISGIDRKEVDKAMAELKKEGAIVSPKRCYWTTAK